MPKVSTFLIGMVLIGMSVGILGLYMGNLSENYGVDYDNSSVVVYNQLDDLKNISESVRDATDISEEPNITDILGDFFKNAYNALIITAKGFTTFGVIKDQALKDVPLGGSTAYVRAATSAIVLIIIFLVVIIGAVIKRNL